MKRLLAFAGLVVGAALFLIAVAGIELAEVAMHPVRLPIKRPQVARAAATRAGGILEDAEVPSSDGAVLRGWFIAPQKGNGSAVILFHGVSDNREGMIGFAPLFLNAGYAVLLPDARAHGESGGAFATYGLTERHDIHNWVDWLERTHPANCVYGFGESMGAGLVMQSLAVERRFCAVAEESGFARFRAVAIDRLADKASLPRPMMQVLAAPVVEAAFWYARLRHGFDFSLANPQDAIAHSKVPVLLIHGTDDTNILPVHAEWLHAANPTATELWEVPGANHCGAVNARPQEFDARVLGWFATHGLAKAESSR